MLKTKGSVQSQIGSEIAAGLIAIAVGSVVLLPVSLSILSLANILLATAGAEIRLSYLSAFIMAPTGMLAIFSLRTCWELLDR